MTDGLTTIHDTPMTARVMNHTTMTGPNMAPTLAVPRDWIRNSPTRITTVITTTYGSNTWVAIASPSTAPSTEMAGVIIPSP